MLNSTKTAPALAQMQLTLNNYIWGINAPGLSVSTDTTDEIFNRIKPILRKNPDPIYLSFTIDGLLKNSTLRDKVQKLISNISTDFSVSGMYNVAPIVEYVLFRPTDTDQGLSSQPELYFKKATAKSSGGLDFNYRDVMIQTLLPIVEEQSTKISNETSTSDKSEKYLKDLVTLINLVGSDLIALSYYASNPTTIDNYASRISILIDSVKQYAELSESYINFFAVASTDDNRGGSYVNAVSDGLSALYDVVEQIESSITSNIGQITTEKEYKRMFELLSTEILNSVPAVSSAITDNLETFLGDFNDPVPTNTTPSFNFDKVVFFIRLYPRAAQIAYPNVNITTGSVSDNRLLSVVNGATNLECVFSGNIALNTIDAQWLDLYANLFEFMTTTNISAGFSIKFGNITLDNCYFKNSPRMINTGEPISLFDLNIISTIRSLSGINVNNYGDNFSDALQ